MMLDSVESPSYLVLTIGALLGGPGFDCGFLRRKFWSTVCADPVAMQEPRFGEAFSFQTQSLQFPARLKKNLHALVMCSRTCAASRADKRNLRNIGPGRRVPRRPFLGPHHRHANGQDADHRVSASGADA